MISFYIPLEKLYAMMIDNELLISLGANYKNYATEEIIFKEGSTCNFYYQLIEGTVRWVNINEEGKEFIQTIVSPGECFGELPLFDDMPFAATAISNTDTIVWRLHKSTFIKLIHDIPEIHFKFSNLLSQRLRYKFLILKELAYNDPEHRISALLNHFKETHSNICQTCNQLQLTRQQIADMTGLRVETVIRAMRNMHDKGEVQIKKGKVYCKNCDDDMTEIIH